MSSSQKSSGKVSPQPKKNDSDNVVNPIHIARARHASTHGTSVLNKTGPVPTGSTSRQRTQSTSIPARSYRPTSQGLFQLDGFNGCLLLLLLGVVFLLGGILGGVVGGGMLLWVNNPENTALLSESATPTPIPSPTPAPAATPTPTLTPEPIVTPAMEDIIAQTIPSVVTVINQQDQVITFNDDEGQVVGSGVIVDERGYIATNHHVIQNSGDLRVILADGREVFAELVAADPTEDLAILKVSLDGLQAITWGDSGTVRLGQEVYAIGSPLGDFPNSVSFGIISGLNRALEMKEHVIDGLIQTDAAINRGSSGGPLINAHGEMIGINTFIIRESEDRGVAEGIAFAIPADSAKNLLTPWIAAHSGESVPIPASGETGE